MVCEALQLETYSRFWYELCIQHKTNLISTIQASDLIIGPNNLATSLTDGKFSVVDCDTLTLYWEVEFRALGLVYSSLVYLLGLKAFFV